MDAIDQLPPLPKTEMSAEDVAEEKAAEAAEGTAEENAVVVETSAAEAEVAASAAAPATPAEPELKLLQPDYAFEMHGALTRGWHAQRYVATNEDGEITHHLVVLR